MAKTENTTKVAETTENTTDSVNETNENSAEKTVKNKVKVMLPSDPFVHGNGNEQEFFSVNGHNILVKTDEIVEVDQKFAEVINNKAKARREAKAFAKKMAVREPE